MAKKSIFSNDIPVEKDKNLVEEVTTGEDSSEKSFLGKNLQKFANTPLISDSVTSIKREAEGTFNSFKDRFKPKSLRQDGKNGDFIVDDVSIANRHRDAISGILSDAFNGNLFDVGASALNLLNFGTKWKIFYDQYVNKDIWSFRYKYYSMDNSLLDIDLEGTETNGGYVDFLNSLEDPTILGFSTKINYNTSPLFKGVGIDLEETEPEDSIFNDSSLNSAMDFITRYSVQHREMVMCQEYLEEFTESIKKIFEAPETISEDGRKYNDKEGYKNHYIYEIKGLDKLDNHFVEYGETNEKHETLEILLGEDVRMYTNKLKFLYKNLTWSYNMGKKLIPENKLRFDLYIKVSDIRDFTSKNNGLVRDSYSRVIYELKDCEFLFDTSLNPSSLKVGGFNGVNDEYANLNLKIKYRKVNRIFYSKMFGNDAGGVGDMYIGDKFYESNNEEKAINYTSNYGEELRGWGFSPNSTKKRDAKSNNIEVEESLSSRLDRLKNGGLFVGEDNNDSALNRFAKGIGNEAVKAGASIVDEGLQKVKNNLNNQQSKVDGLFGNNFAGSVRDFLDGNTGKKTTTLGDLHLRANSDILNPNSVFDENNQIVPNINNDVQGSLTVGAETLSDHASNHTPVVSPNEDLHGVITTGVETPASHTTDHTAIIPPNDDRHGVVTTGAETPASHTTDHTAIVPPNDDRHGVVTTGAETPASHTTDHTSIVPPNDDRHGVVTTGAETPADHTTDHTSIVPPNDDRHGVVTTGAESISDHSSHHTSIVPPSGDLHGVVTTTAETKSDHDANHTSIIPPSGDLHGVVTTTAETKSDHDNNHTSIIPPNGDLHGVVTTGAESLTDHGNNHSPITNPSGDLHGVVTTGAESLTDHGNNHSPITNPSGDLHPILNQPVGNPNNDLHPNVNQPIVNPNDDKHPNVNQPIVNPNEDKHPQVNGTVSLNEVNVNGKVNSDITVPDDDKHPQVKKGIDSPKTLSDNFSKFIRKDPQQDKARKPDEDCED